MGCKGLHCDGCRDGGPLIGAGALALLIGAALYAVHRRAIDHAVSEAVHFVLIAALALAGVAVTAAATAVTVQVRRHRARRQLVAPLRDYVLAPGARSAVAARRPDQIAPAARPAPAVAPARRRVAIGRRAAGGERR